MRRHRHPGAVPDAEQSGGPRGPIRVAIQQPSLPRFRVPVYRELASRLELRLRVYHGRGALSPPSVEAAAFEACHIPIHLLSTPLGLVIWHRAQWLVADPRVADVAIMMWNTRCLSLLPALLRARLRGVPVVLWGHGFSKTEARWRRWLRNRITALASAVLFYNHSAAGRFVDEGHDPRRVFVALNSLDQAPIQAARRAWLAQPQRLEALRSRLGLTRGRTVLFVSRLLSENRIDLLLEAAAKLLPRMPQLKVLIVGEGEPEGTQLRRLCAELGIERHVHFVGAIYREDDLAPYFLCSDVFCYPSHMGLSILHAFGYGLPVVCGNEPQTHGPEFEALRPGENGELFPPGDVQGLSEVLGALLEDEPRCHRMAEAALDTAQRRFTLERMVDGFEAAIRSCLR